MRRKLATISILFVFLLLQYGKVATYIYCKWQAEVVQKLKDCGCENHLAGMFSEKTSDGLSPITVKEVISEYIVELPDYYLPSTPTFTISQFAEYDSPLLNGFFTSSFRPPAV